jgi:hypothetical protein
MTAADTSHYLENQFLNATRDSRKRCRMLAEDHNGKLAARAAGNPVITAIQTGWLPVFNAWTLAYNNWQIARAAYRSCTQKLDNLTEQLRVTPTGGGRSKLDEWEGRVAGLFAVADPVYQYLFPQGREPFTRQGRDATIAEVLTLSTRIAAKLPELTTARDNVQLQVDALVAGAVTPPDALLDELALAQERVETLGIFANRINAFHGAMLAARNDQQGRESDLDATALEVEKQRIRICRRMYANMGTLIGIYTETDSPEPEPQLKVAEFFQFELLSLTTAEEEPIPEPEPPVPVP